MLLPLRGKLGEGGPFFFLPRPTRLIGFCVLRPKPVGVSSLFGSRDPVPPSRSRRMQLGIFQHSNPFVVLDSFTLCWLLAFGLPRPLLCLQFSIHSFAFYSFSFSLFQPIYTATCLYPFLIHLSCTPSAISLPLLPRANNPLSLTLSFSSSYLE